MDLLSFRSLYDTCERLEMARQIDFVWMMNVAAQGAGKDVKTWQQERWSHVTDTAKGLGDLFSRYGSGI